MTRLDDAERLLFEAVSKVEERLAKAERVERTTAEAASLAERIERRTEGAIAQLRELISQKESSDG